jgi:hypothetical protein
MNGKILSRSLALALLSILLILPTAFAHAQTPPRDCSNLKGEELIKCMQENNRTQTQTGTRSGTTGKTSGTIYPGRGK